MARVAGRDTGPEMAVRRVVHRLGFRYRLYRRDLPGSPDLVLTRLRTVIFVHGCFWHWKTAWKSDPAWGVISAE
jgi:DNA mismatch endonuclease (patch repair protein)